MIVYFATDVIMNLIINNMIQVKLVMVTQFVLI